jgi:hypothetical protein
LEKPTVCGVNGSGVTEVGGAAGARTSGVGVTPDSLSALRAAAASSPALAHRSSGSLARPLSTTSSSALGSSGRIDDGAGASVLRCAYISTASPSPVNGRRPVRTSKSTQARA